MSANRVVVIDNSHIAELLGYNDSVIRVVEKAYPAVAILVRGNEISLHGTAAEVDEVVTAIEELRSVLDAGAVLNADIARETVRMLRKDLADDVTDTSTVLELDPELQSALKSAREMELKAQAEPTQLESEPALESELELEPDLETEPESEPALESELELEPHLETELESETEFESESEPEPVRAPALTSTPAQRPAQVLSRSVLSSRGRTIRPKTEGQAKYVNAIEQHTITFGIGPAGTGKTYLAMAQAVAALQAKRVNRIVLTRPAVEAGERLGFLPGSLSEKIDPYLRPLYDALHDMLDPDSIPRLMEAGTIEVAPLAYMRGRTLNDAFVILDEAQNTTREQMKMFLTRLGFGATMVVTGDVTQVDLPGGTQSGLRAASEILEGVEDISFCYLGAEDVVRHRLVSDIITAYSAADEAREAAPGRRAMRTDGQQRRLKTTGETK